MKMVSTDVHDEHDRGLAYDLEQMAALRERRRVLGWMLSGSAVALMAGCGGGSEGSGASSTNTTAAGGTMTTTGSTGSSGGSSGTSTNGTCIADPEETAGPYPSDGSNTVNGAASNVLVESGIVRNDIRSSFGGFIGVAGGVPLTLTLTVLNSNNLCAPLAGYAIYLWHCTREGAYSLYSPSVQDQNFLRGVQVTDASGLVTFQTIFPGCYSGRYPHIHFEVYPTLSLATLYTNKVLTSQMALPRDVCSSVYSGASGYATSVTNLASVTTGNDNVFGNNTAAQITAMTPVLTGSIAAGYVGNIVIGVPA